MSTISRLPSTSVLTAAFEQRFSQESHRTKEVLLNSKELREFLPKAIDFLRADDSANANAKAHSTELVAHYLMGKVGYLPGDLDQQRPEITSEVGDALFDLLRTHRYGAFGRAEVPEKTIAKLEALNRLLESHALEEWKNAGPSTEKKSREVTVQFIQECIEKKSDSLLLHKLTTIPPLPSGLKLETFYLHSCDLASINEIPENLKAKNIHIISCAKIASLKGIPGEFDSLAIESCDSLTSLEGMPDKLEKLGISSCKSLTSLEGMPDKLEKLKQLKINSCKSLTSLEGMPKKMNKLESLGIYFCDSLTSLKGIPKEINKLELLDIFFCNSLTSLEEMPKEMNNLKFLNLSQNRALDSVITVNELFRSQDNAKLNISNDQPFSDRLVLDIHRLLQMHPNRISISNQLFQRAGELPGNLSDASTDEGSSTSSRDL